MTKWDDDSWQKDFLEHEISFSFRCKTLVGRQRFERCLAIRCSARRIRKTEETTRRTETAMKEKINWQK